MDVVIQFAVHKLGFQLNDIIIYAWSIGGFTGTLKNKYMFSLFISMGRILTKPYHDILIFLIYLILFPLITSLRFSFVLPLSATWATMSYPEIQAIVLDASFDDLLPLALKVMPESWSES